MDIEWLDEAEAAKALGVTPATVRTMTRNHELASVDRRVPALFLQDGAVVKGLAGLLTLLHDNGFSDREAIDWLFLDEDYPGRAIDALRENRGSEVKRRAQALL